jgi:SpoIID/LytB domain protein
VTYTHSPQIIRAIPDLRSTFFVVDEIHDEEGEVEEFHFIGGGWGHGVGMCQMGAYMRGLAGQSHSEILQAYYPLADIRRLY